MIKSFRIGAQKDEKGLYILPKDIGHLAQIISSLRYHESAMNQQKNLLFAIVWVVSNKIKGSCINGYTEFYVRVNDVPLYFNRFLLDKENDVLYETDTNDELVLIKRGLKVKKILK